MDKYIKYITIILYILLAILVGEFIEHIYGVSVINDGITLYALILVCITECIVLETLDISGQKARDSVVPEKYKSTALYKLYLYILYKVQEQGVKIIHADKYFPSTKQCCRCKTLNNVGASKTYTCSYCGITIDRDYNAAINLYMLNIL